MADLVKKCAVMLETPEFVVQETWRTQSYISNCACHKTMSKHIYAVPTAISPKTRVLKSVESGQNWIT